MNPFGDNHLDFEVSYNSLSYRSAESYGTFSLSLLPSFLGMSEGFAGRKGGFTFVSWDSMLLTVCFDLQRNIFRTLFISEREEEIDFEESLSEPFRSSLLEFVVFFFSDFLF